MNLSHQVVAICKRYVDLGVAQADFSAVKRLRRRDLEPAVADADERRVLFVPRAGG
ncbi:MAG: hypothetical protein IPH23_09420 [Gammaproteobacteria bacterium]|nr:hypothetical protein [Gammaproteobacteria bacterium]